MFATKTGLITNTPPDVNEFVNLQVERMYMKIEKVTIHPEFRRPFSRT
jgi:hypothetical protein